MSDDYPNLEDSGEDFVVYKGLKTDKLSDLSNKPEGFDNGVS